MRVVPAVRRLGTTWRLGARLSSMMKRRGGLFTEEDKQRVGKTKEESV